MLYNTCRLRYGKIGSQLGTGQKYYISQCEEKQSIQLTITMAGDEEEHTGERRNLIDDITKLLDDIMKVFMPATKERPSLLIPCPFCPKLHIPLDDACSGKAIFCPNDDDKPLPFGYYSDLLQGRVVDTDTAGKVVVTNCCLHITINLIGVDRKLEVFIACYSKLTCLNFKALCPHLITARIISIEDSQTVQRTVESSIAASHVLGKIYASLKGGTDVTFDGFLSILENQNDSFCTSLVKEMKSDLLKSTNGIVCVLTLYSWYHVLNLQLQLCLLWKNRVIKLLTKQQVSNTCLTS